MTVHAEHPTGFRLASAEAYVLANGTPRQVAYWKAAFGWGPVETWLFEMEPYQGPQGGWDAGLVRGTASQEDSLSGTAEALRWLAWVNMGEDVFEVLPRTLRFLQGGEGHWGDDSLQIAAYLSFMGELPEEVDRVAAHMFGRTAELGPIHQALWLSLAPRLPHAQAAAAALGANQALQQAELGAMSTGRLSWLHEALVQAGLPGADPLRARIHELLAARQLPEGHFPADDQAWDAVETTFFASRVLTTL